MATATAPPEQETPETDGGLSALYRYSAWIHIGPDAETCDDGETGACGNPLHFHAWARLPNQFQHREIREKAQAAKARRVRQLRDPETDACAVMEDDLDRLARIGDSAKADIVDELLSVDWWRDHLEALEDTRAAKDPDSDDDDALLWEHIADDQRRFAELNKLDEDERPADEYLELEKRLTAYNAAVEEAEEKLRAPRRTELQKKDVNALIDLLRDQRIDADSTEEFMHTYAAHEWLACTRRAPDGPVLWEDAGALRDLAPEAMQAIKDVYDDLERTQREAAAQGNS